MPIRDFYQADPPEVLAFDRELFRSRQPIRQRRRPHPGNCEYPQGVLRRDFKALAKEEFATLGLVREDEINDGAVVRVPKAYPMYDDGWSDQVQTIRGYLETICQTCSWSVETECTNTTTK